VVGQPEVGRKRGSKRSNRERHSAARRLLESGPRRRIHTHERGVPPLRNGGEGGIRTHGRISPTHAFQACSLNRSDTSPSQQTSYQSSRKRHITHNRPSWDHREALLHFYHRLRGRLIGRTPDFGSGYPGSSPGPGANPIPYEMSHFPFMSKPKGTRHKEASWGRC
jgi:hypothetical protein